VGLPRPRAGVGLVQYVDAGPVWLAVMAVVAVGALVTLAVTGHVVQRSVSRS
jgi:putative effector of murein hydrolase LrgA (UPF0299 family)